MGTKTKLTFKQLKFIEAYDGNGTKAARIAGYPGSDAVLSVTASRLLRNVKIVDALKNRANKKLAPIIATREERQAFWTQSMKLKKYQLRDRLKASELLGRSEADFIDRRELSGPNGAPIQTQEIVETEAERVAREERVIKMLASLNVLKTG